ncbi:MAG: hypothetical protein ACXVCY_12375 [Pseudobdellovibrionaceae bacterium]
MMLRTLLAVTIITNINFTAFARSSTSDFKSNSKSESSSTSNIHYGSHYGDNSEAPKSSQNDTIRINLQFPTSMMTDSGVGAVALNRIETANKKVTQNLNNNHICEICDFFTEGHPPEKSNTSLSFTYGNGKTFASDPSEGGTQQWNFNLRLSHAIGDGCQRIDTGLLNEGHPINHHRDGFYLQLTCRKEVLKNITAEFGAGPYFSMDTTKPNRGSELDQKGINILATAAVNYYIGKSGLHLRLECDGVKSTPALGNGPDSVQCMAGIGQDFSRPGGESSSSSSSSSSKRDYAIAVGPVWSKTNHGGTSSAYGESVELSKDSGPWMTRLGFLATGNDGAINNRRGMSIDVDYKFPIGSSGKHSLYTGAGVYLDRNYNADRNEVNGNVTFLGYEYDVNKDYFIRVDYNRVFTFSNAPKDHKEADSDVIRMEIGARL